MFYSDPNFVGLTALSFILKSGLRWQEIVYRSDVHLVSQDVIGQPIGRKTVLGLRTDSVNDFLHDVQIEDRDGPR